MKKIVSAGLIFLLCCLSVCASCEEEPAVVRVTGITYPSSLVQFTLTTTLDLNEGNGVTLSEADRMSLAESSLMRYADLGILEMKLEEAGQNGFTDEEMEDLEIYAEEAFDTNLNLKMYSRSYVFSVLTLLRSGQGSPTTSPSAQLCQKRKILAALYTF